MSPEDCGDSLFCKEDVRGNHYCEICDICGNDGQNPIDGESCSSVCSNEDDTEGNKNNKQRKTRILI